MFQFDIDTRTGGLRRIVSRDYEYERCVFIIFACQPLEIHIGVLVAPGHVWRITRCAAALRLSFTQGVESSAFFCKFIGRWLLLGTERRDAAKMALVRLRTSTADGALDEEFLRMASAGMGFSIISYIWTGGSGHPEWLTQDTALW